MTIQPLPPASGWRGRWRAARPVRAPRWPMPDFLPRRRRSPPLAWALAATGVACALLGGGQALQQRQALQSAEQARSRWLAEVDRLQAAAAKRRTPDDSPEPSPRARAEAHRVAQRLSHRWNQVLPPLEQPGVAGVQWLRLAHDTGRGDLVLEGRARSREDALRLAALLAATTGWQAVLLQRVEASLDGAGDVRFEIAARVARPEATP